MWKARSRPEPQWMSDTAGWSGRNELRTERRVRPLQ